MTYSEAGHAVMTGVINCIPAKSANALHGVDSQLQAGADAGQSNRQN